MGFGILASVFHIHELVRSVGEPLLPLSQCRRISAYPVAQRCSEKEKPFLLHWLRYLTLAPNRLYSLFRYTRNQILSASDARMNVRTPVSSLSTLTPDSLPSMMVCSSPVKCTAWPLISGHIRYPIAFIKLNFALLPREKLCILPHY